MRVIDAHEIEKILTYTEFDRDNKPEWLESPVEAYRHFLGIIQNAPTAFDADKVVEKLRDIQIKSNDSKFSFGIDRAIEVIEEGMKS